MPPCPVMSSFHRLKRSYGEFVPLSINNNSIASSLKQQLSTSPDTTSWFNRWNKISFAPLSKPFINSISYTRRCYTMARLLFPDKIKCGFKNWNIYLLAHMRFRNPHRSGLGKKSHAPHPFYFLSWPSSFRVFAVMGRGHHSYLNNTNDSISSMQHATSLLMDTSTSPKPLAIYMNH